MIKNKKTIKRQKNLQKQIGKGKGSAGRNNSACRNNLSTQTQTQNQGDKLYVNLQENLKLVNRILDRIKLRSPKDQDDELRKVFKLLKMIRSVADLAVINQNGARLEYIKREMKSILERINNFRDLRQSSV